MGSKHGFKVLAAIAIFSAFFSWWGIVKFRSCAGPEGDMAIFDQAFFTAAKYGMPFSNYTEASEIGKEGLLPHFAIHFTPFLYLLLPFYMLWPYAETLIVLQTLAIGASAWLLFILARDVMEESTACILAVAFLFYHPMHGVTYSLFHDLGFVLPLLLLLFWQAWKLRWWRFWLVVPLLWSVREDAGVAAFGIGLSMLVTAWRRPDHHRPAWLRHGALLCLASVAYVVVVLHQVIPSYLHGDYAQFGWRYHHLGGSLGSVVASLVLHPERAAEFLSWGRLKYLGELLLPLTFLPLTHPLAVAVVPTLGGELLANWPWFFRIVTPYAASLVPMLWVATVFAVAARTSAESRRKCAWRVLAATVLCMLIFGLTPASLGRRMPRVDARARAILSMAASIPEPASVATQSDLMQYVTHHLLARTGYQRGVDYILVDSSTPAYAQDHWDAVLSGYEVVRRENTVMLLRKVPFRS